MLLKVGYNVEAILFFLGIHFLQQSNNANASLN